MNNINVYNRRLPELELKNKPKLIISKQLQSEIMCLHNKVGDVEWSGPLFYKIVEGDINAPASLILKALHVFPYDVGSSSYTEYDFGPEIMDFYDAYPECAPGGGVKWGHCHTHHSMATFFSGTDTGELHDNAGGHNYYLSLIVNHKSQFCAKIAMVANRVTKAQVINTQEDYLKIKGTDGTEDRINLIINTNTPEEEKSEQVLLLMDCEIEFEQDKFFQKRVQEVTTAPKRATFHQYSSPYVNVAGFKTQWEKDQEAKKAGKKDDETRYPYLNSQRQLWPGDDNYYKNDIDYTVTKPSNKVIFDALELRSFLVKWLTDDFMNEERISDVLRDINNTTRGKKNVLDDFLDKLDRNIDKYYQYTFQAEPSNENIDQLCTQCVGILNQYKDQYNVTQDIIDLLDLYIEVETPDFIETNKE
jgi:hypothetical protein